MIGLRASRSGQRSQPGEHRTAADRREGSLNLADREIGETSDLRKECMSANAKQDQFRLGFLTAIEVPEMGFVGGLLVTNRHGRPLEFQCTAPVKANRTQEILYGPTLGPFLMGEVIGRALIEKSGIKPHLILTEKAEILELRQHISVPVACLEPDKKSASDANSPTEVAAASTIENATSETAAAPEPKHETTGSLLRLGRQYVRFHAGHATDCELFEKESTQVPRDADLREPFDRVREALNETVRSGALK